MVWHIEKDAFDTAFDADRKLGELFCNPVCLSTDGNATLVESAFSPSGKLWAYGLSTQGSESYTVRGISGRPISLRVLADTLGTLVRRTCSPIQGNGSDTDLLPDIVHHVRHCNIVWYGNDEGFFYQRPAIAELDDWYKPGQGATDGYASIYYHRLGTEQAQDTLVLQDRQNPGNTFKFTCSGDYTHLVAAISRDSSYTNAVWVTSLPLSTLEDHDAAKQFRWSKLTESFASQHEYVADAGSVFYFRTNSDAASWKVVKYDLNHPELVSVMYFVAQWPNSEPQQGFCNVKTRHPS